MYYLHIFLPLMHFYIKCITYMYDLSVIVEWRTARCRIQVRDTLSHHSLHYPLAKEVAKGYSNAPFLPSVSPSFHNILVNTLESASFNGF